jgi:hypothetical protein
MAAKKASVIPVHTLGQHARPGVPTGVVDVEFVLGVTRARRRCEHDRLLVKRDETLRALTAKLQPG